MEFEEYLGEFSEEEKDQFKQQLTEWKEQYDGAVFVIEINDIAFIWRGLTKAEFKRANEFFEDDYERSEYVSKLCVLHPKIDDYSLNMYAGVPEVLAENILRESGFTLTIEEFDSKLAKYERDMGTLDNQIPCVIKEAFPDISLEEIENWQFEKTLDYYAKAKWVLSALRGVELEREETPEIPGLPKGFPVAPTV